MQVPLQITYRGLTPSDSLEARIRAKAAKLEEFHPGIISCRVVLEETRRATGQGKLFNVRLDLHLPGREFAVNREENDDAYVALREAFDAARRIIEDDIRIARGDTKNHETPPR